jgi:hypothetical protein
METPMKKPDGDADEEADEFDLKPIWRPDADGSDLKPIWVSAQPR